MVRTPESNRLQGLLLGQLLQCQVHSNALLSTKTNASILKHAEGLDNIGNHRVSIFIFLLFAWLEQWCLNVGLRDLCSNLRSILPFCQ